MHWAEAEEKKIWLLIHLTEYLISWERKYLHRWSIYSTLQRPFRSARGSKMYCSNHRTFGLLTEIWVCHAMCIACPRVISSCYHERWIMGRFIKRYALPQESPLSWATTPSTSPTLIRTLILRSHERLARTDGDMDMPVSLPNGWIILNNQIPRSIHSSQMASFSLYLPQTSSTTSRKSRSHYDLVFSSEW